MIIKTDIETIECALTVYYSIHSQYPSEILWISGIEQFVRSDRTFTDPWGNAYCYNHPAIHNKDMDYEIYSKGRDGISESRGNDPDDITNWGKKVMEYPEIHNGFTSYFSFLSQGITVFIDALHFVWSSLYKIFT